MSFLCPVKKISQTLPQHTCEERQKKRRHVLRCLLSSGFVSLSLVLILSCLVLSYSNSPMSKTAVSPLHPLQLEVSRVAGQPASSYRVVVRITAAPLHHHLLHGNQHLIPSIPLRPSLRPEQLYNFEHLTIPLLYKAILPRFLSAHPLRHDSSNPRVFPKRAL